MLPHRPGMTPRNDSVYRVILPGGTSAERPTLPGGRGTPGTIGVRGGPAAGGAGAGGRGAVPKPPKKSRSEG
jgi:hypothetical protein